VGIDGMIFGANARPAGWAGEGGIFANLPNLTGADISAFSRSRSAAVDAMRAA
jgi:hypothetical protein